MSVELVVQARSLGSERSSRLVRNALLRSCWSVGSSGLSWLTRSVCSFRLVEWIGPGQLRCLFESVGAEGLAPPHSTDWINVLGTVRSADRNDRVGMVILSLSFRWVWSDWVSRVGRPGQDRFV